MHTAWATAKCGVQVVSFFRSAHLHEHKDQMPALRIAFCTHTFDGWLQVLLRSLRLESSNCPERIIVRYQGPGHSVVSRRALSSGSASQNS
jgi:hypothetical protein